MCVEKVFHSTRLENVLSSMELIKSIKFLYIWHRKAGNTTLWNYKWVFARIVNFFLPAVSCWRPGCKRENDKLSYSFSFLYFLLLFWRGWHISMSQNHFRFQNLRKYWWCWLYILFIYVNLGITEWKRFLCRKVVFYIKKLGWMTNIISDRIMV
jgi:hypothetical protein